MRATISEIGEHPWVNKNGEEPLPPHFSLVEKVEDARKEQIKPQELKISGLIDA